MKEVDGTDLLFCSTVKPLTKDIPERDVILITSLQKTIWKSVPLLI